MATYKNSAAAQKRILNMNVRREIILYIRSHQNRADSRNTIDHVASVLHTSKQRVSGNISAMNRCFHGLGIVVHKPHKKSDLYLITSNNANSTNNASADDKTCKF